MSSSEKKLVGSKNLGHKKRSANELGQRKKSWVKKPKKAFFKCQCQACVFISASISAVSACDFSGHPDIIFVRLSV